MSIVSFWFYIFVAISLIVFYIIPKRIQWPFLLAISFIFLYLNSSIPLLLLFGGIVFVAWIGALLIDKAKGKNRRLICIITVTVLVCILFYCKDRQFINIIKHFYNSIFGMWFHQLDYKVYSIIYLLGMSYFTLSLIGYVLDIYWGKYKVELNYFKLLLFSGYFPQLTSGPINRYDELSKELFSEKTFNYDAIIWGIERTIWGCIKKLVIADRVASYVSYTFDFQSTEGIWVFGGILLYALQLYMDFSGSMDIIMGVSECFQIRLPENFHTPFASKTFAEFWRRWHITMGVWFKEYLLYPILKSERFQKFNKFTRKKLGKRYGKKIATCVGLSVIWFTIGLWHGGSSTYIITSGLIPGFFLVAGELLEDFFAKARKMLHIDTDNKVYCYFCHIKILLIMCCSWIVMRAGSAGKAFEIIKKAVNIGTVNNMFHIWDWYYVIRDNSNGLSGKLLVVQIIVDALIIIGAVILLIYVGVKHEREIHIRDEIAVKPTAVRWAIILAALFLILLFGIYGPGYNASDFIYKEF